MKGTGISHDFKLVPVAKKGRLSEINESKEDLQYWLSRPAGERIAAVTFLVFQSLSEGQRMDKSVVRKKRSKVRFVPTSGKQRIL